MTMTPKRQKLAKLAFDQGIKDEDENRYPVEVGRLKIDYRVRDFYDAARRQRAEQLRPEREAAAAAYLEQEKLRDAEASERLLAAIPAIKAELSKNNALGAARLVLNAQIGI
jgi:hypothetical protein